MQGYDPALGTRSYRTISSAVCCDHPLSGQIYHIVIHQAIKIPGLKHHLLCTMQARTNGVTVNDCPKYLCDQPTDETHTIVCADERGEKIFLPLNLNGVTSCLTVRSLIELEWQSAAYPRVTLTNADLTWDPIFHTYAEQENAMCGFRGKLFEKPLSRGDL